MQVKAWTSKARDKFVAAGSGIQITNVADRERYFQRHWSEVHVVLEDGDVVVARLKETFWTTCPELRGAAIGRWLIRRGLAPWPQGERPTLTLTPLGGNRFALVAST